MGCFHAVLREPNITEAPRPRRLRQPFSLLQLYYDSWCSRMLALWGLSVWMSDEIAASWTPLQTLKPQPHTDLDPHAAKGPKMSYRKPQLFLCFKAYRYNTYIHTYVRTYIHIYVHTYIHTCIWYYLCRICIWITRLNQKKASGCSIAAVYLKYGDDKLLGFRV